jgi:predicted MFS family arabinose efflux permease
MLCIGTAMFGLFFFLTLFSQTVLGYSAVRSGLSYLPFTAGIVTAATLASRLMPRIGARPLILAGTTAIAGGMFWFSRPAEHAGSARRGLRRVRLRFPPVTADRRALIWSAYHFSAFRP